MPRHPFSVRGSRPLSISASMNDLSAHAQSWLSRPWISEWTLKVPFHTDPTRIYIHLAVRRWKTLLPRALVRKLEALKIRKRLPYFALLKFDLFIHVMRLHQFRNGQNTESSEPRKPSAVNRALRKQSPDRSRKYKTLIADMKSKIQKTTRCFTRCHQTSIAVRFMSAALHRWNPC